MIINDLSSNGKFYRNCIQPDEEDESKMPNPFNQILECENSEPDEEGDGSMIILEDLLKDNDNSHIPTSFADQLNNINEAHFQDLDDSLESHSAEGQENIDELQKSNLSHMRLAFGSEAIIRE